MANELDQIKNSITKLPTDELHEIVAWIFEYQNRREAEDRYKDAFNAELVLSYRNAGRDAGPDALENVPEDPSGTPEWVNPNGDLKDCYQKGDIVQHNDELWKCVVDDETLLAGEEPSGESLQWESLGPVTAAPDDEA